MKDIILNELKYDREPMSARLSASMINDDLFHQLMVIKHGALNADISQATIGSIFHKGMETIFKNQNISNEVKLEPIKYSGFEITGTADLVDFNSNTVYDVKLIKHSKYAGGKSFKGLKDKTNGEDDDYFIQLNIYRYLLEKEYGKPFNMKLLLFFKDGGWDYRAKQAIPNFKTLEVPKIDNSKIESYIANTIEHLLDYIDFNENGSIKEVHLDRAMVGYAKECQEKYGFITTKSGQKKPSRCALYCEYNTVCKAYNSSNDEQMLDW
jgi:hypothetical protein